MIPIELWRARIGLFNVKCRSGSSLYFCFSFLFDPHSRCRGKNGVSSAQDPPDPSSLTTAGTSEAPTTRLSPSISSPVSSSISPNLSPEHSPSQLSTTTSHASRSLTSSSSGSCSIKSTLSSSSWCSVLFSFLPSCSRSYSSGVCRSVLRGTALIILLITSIISQQLIVCAGDVETNPGPIASDRPKLPQLILIKKADGTKVEVIKSITSHELWRCVDFANMLLRDDVLVRRYQNGNIEKDEFVRVVLLDWLSRDDDDSTDSAVPRTWSALAECVSDAGLDGTLAKAIRDACPSVELTSQSGTLAESILFTTTASILLARALKHGFVILKITKLLISGAAATGKSSLIAMLLGKPPVRTHNSTLLSRPARHARFTAEGDSYQKWECFDEPADLEELLANDIACRKHFSKQQPSGSEAESTSAESSFSEPNVRAAYNKSETFASLVPRLKSAVKSNRLQKVHWIYTIDSGGQPAFLDVLPAFIRGNSVAIHTLKLDHPLNGPIKMVFSIDGQMCESEELCMTSLQQIKTLVRSSSSSYFLAESAKTAKPHCIIVGTFYDKIRYSTEQLKVIDQELQDNLQHSDATLVSSGHGIIFPVDTTVGGDEREEKASELREMITADQASMERKIPIKWFTFELELRKRTNEQGILSMDECIQVGKLFEMDVDEVKACIKYLHEQTLLLYFEKPLPNTVFMNAQSILDKVSAIIFVSLLSNKTRQLRRAIRKLPNGMNDVNSLRSQGRFDGKLLDCLPDVLALALSKEQSVLFTDIFTGDNLLALLKDLLIIAKLPEEDQYFIPCVLPTNAALNELRKDFLKIRGDDACTWDNYAFCFCWDKKTVPLGLFPALVVQLLQRGNSKEYRLLEKQQFRNAISLDCPPIGGAVLLVDSIDWMEVYYLGADSKRSQIRQAIIDGISAVVKAFGYQDELCEPRQGFYCQVLQECRDCTHKHLCFVPTSHDQRTITTCSKHSKVDNCSRQQMCWFDSAKAKTGPKADASIILLKLKQHGFPNYKWMELAVGLEMGGTLGKYQGLLNDQAKLSAMVTDWTASANELGRWETLVTAVNMSGQGIVAQNLAKDLGIQPPS